MLSSGKKQYDIQFYEFINIDFIFVSTFVHNLYILLSFRSDEDLLHRLFVCISGVADQLQTNFAGDLRNILKAVFLMSNSNCGTPDSQTNNGLFLKHILKMCDMYFIHLYSNYRSIDWYK